MTQKQILESLIPLYWEQIQKAADGGKVDYRFSSGICWAMSDWFPNIYEFTYHHNNWITTVAVRATDVPYGYWYNPPFRAKTAYEVIECLAYRLTIMQMMLDDMEK